MKREKASLLEDFRANELTPVLINEAREGKLALR